MDELSVGVVSHVQRCVEVELSQLLHNRLESFVPAKECEHERRSREQREKGM